MIKHHKSINSYLDSLIQESVKSALKRNTIREEEKQDALAKGDSGDSGEEKPKMGGEEEKKKLKKGDVAVEDVVNNLNSIRSGKSFKDEAIRGSLEKYFNDLSRAEQVALVAYLKGISQVVSGEVPGDNAIEPADKEPAISMSKKNEPQTRSVKPNVIKAPEVKKSKSKPSAEDSSGPVPIAAKK